MNLDYSPKKKYKDRKDYPEPEEIDELDMDKLPKPIDFLLNRIMLTDGNGWMRIIGVLSTFFQAIGLSKESAKEYIFDWCDDRNKIHEQGEYEEADNIVEKIYSSQIMCPNFETLLETDGGFPKLGLKSIFKKYGFDYTNKTKNKNPVTLYLKRINRAPQLDNPHYSNFKKEFLCEPDKMADRINLEETAKNMGYNSCPKCGGEVEFFNNVAKYDCKKCGDYGGYKKFLNGHLNK